MAACRSSSPRRRSVIRDDASPRLAAALADRRRHRGRGHPPAAAARRDARRHDHGEGRRGLRRRRAGPGELPCSTRSRPGAPSSWSPTPGMPLVSDPGHVLVTDAVARGLPVTVHARAVGRDRRDRGGRCSGRRRFCFEGFLPRKAGERRTRLAALAKDPRALVALRVAAPARGVRSPTWRPPSALTVGRRSAGS